MGEYFGFGLQGQVHKIRKGWNSLSTYMKPLQDLFIISVQKGCIIIYLSKSARRTACLISTRERFVIVHQRKPIPHIVHLDLLHRLLATSLGNINRLNDWMQILLARQFQHR